MLKKKMKLKQPDISGLLKLNKKTHSNTDDCPVFGGKGQT